MILGKVFPVFITLLCLTACAEQDLQLKHHCEMVEMFKTTNGQYGWPDYNNTARLCAQEK